MLSRIVVVILLLSSCCFLVSVSYRCCHIVVFLVLVSYRCCHVVVFSYRSRIGIFVVVVFSYRSCIVVVMLLFSRIGLVSMLQQQVTTMICSPHYVCQHDCESHKVRLQELSVSQWQSGEPAAGEVFQQLSKSRQLAPSACSPEAKSGGFVLRNFPKT